MIDHYVVFKPHEGRSEELSQALAEFAAAMRGLESLFELTHGENFNPSGLAQGYTHGCFARLASVEALRGEYWNHDAHQKLLGQLDELCEVRFALDYETA
jgi:hypothetical protein